MFEDSGSIARYKRSNVIVWMAMALQGGILNMGGLISCRRFVSHLTGSVTLIADAAASLAFSNVLELMLVPVGFFLGAFVSGLLVESRLRQGKRPRYYIAFGLLSALSGATALIGIAGYFGEFGKPRFDILGMELPSTIAFICGLQNGIITSVSKSVIRTTHLSGIITDLGVSLSRYFYQVDVERTSDDHRADLMRIGIISFFFTGAALGVKLFAGLEFRGFFVPSIISGILCTLLLRRAFFR